jgi:ketosteroid isomerase-like protein
MMKLIITLFVLLLAMQEGFSQPNIHGLIQAEKSFAQYALDSNVRDAFVKFFDTGNIALSGGEIFNGYQKWLQRSKSPGKIVWGPEMAAIAGSGEMGLTTGPYEIKKTLEDTALGRGHFTSIWVYNEAGEWKNIFDNGINYKPAYPSVTTVLTVTSTAKTESNKGEEDMMKVENGLIESYKKSGKNALPSICAKECWFNTNGHPPIHGQQNLTAALLLLDDALVFHPAGFRIAKSNDLGFVYGSTSLAAKKGNYMRVWIKEAGQWKLLLQLLN